MVAGGVGPRERERDRAGNEWKEVETVGGGCATEPESLARGRMPKGRKVRARNGGR